MQLSFKLLDYDTNSPLANKQVEIRNIDKQEVYPSKNSDNRGIVAFCIKENERADFFSINLLNDKVYFSTPFNLAKDYIQATNSKIDSKDLTKKLFTPNNYQNKYAKVYFKARISLLFDGFNLKILKGENIIESFVARSGNPKDNNLQTSDINIATSTYINPVTKEKNIMYFYYDKDNTQSKYGAIPQGIYYINLANIIESKSNIESKENSPFEIGKTWGKYYTKIYTDKECKNNKVCINTNTKIDSIESNDNIESRTINKEFYLYSINSNNEFGSIGSIGVNNSFFDKIINFSSDSINTQEGIELKVEYNKHSNITIDFITPTLNNIFPLNLSQQELQEAKEYLSNSTFAPGTYIELEAKGLQGNKNVKWQYEVEYIQDNKIIKDSNNPYTINDISNYANNQIYERIGFYLPTERTTQDFTSYKVIVQVIDSSTLNILGSITLDMSFKVIQSDTRYDLLNTLNTNNTNSTNKILKAYNKLDSINSLQEAVEFLKINIKQKDTLYNNNFKRYNKKDSMGDYIYNVLLDYFKIYPQLAGKIAYIYYIYDLVDDDFIDNVKEDNGEYVRDREKFINMMIEIFEKETYKPSFSNNKFFFLDAYNILFKYPSQDNVIEFRKDFIQNLIKVICDNENLPLKRVEFFEIKFKDIMKEKSILNGSYNKKIIQINTLHITNGNDNFQDRILYPASYDDIRDILSNNVTFTNLMNTIFHEIRHFYIEQKYPNFINRCILQSYLWHSSFFYISMDTRIENTIFGEIYKQCGKNNKDANNVNCKIGNYQNVYEIQPNERDPRYVAAHIIKQLQQKGLI
ncbi:hypothetical protein DCO58_05215 [Helicobacter saguini]|uniref:Uncharacterized protein n=1 Tax=Helicobacter saguini TaxID=1548018 RepID=A0A347VT39_9HELI|nr:hypothetical protein [Helicobacter saguini]MWV62251.1 hypothetical protein [Helicobacter saguini]MWV67076.1 hypothetical protein [Helicobacter saguini]MWV69426.1 hypothetical protein [Helicobacter saguini]MWV71020.1 hypothetical protein [Helicobacter saguini]TLD91746.1 hypothetical protein LS64_011340 [Helicobacter saguini]